MKPPRFEYHAPTSTKEALALLQQYGDEAKLLAGGQSLVPMLNMRLARPAALIDLNRVEGLSYIREEESMLAIGAITRHAVIEKSALIARRQPLLAEAARHIGHIQIRNRGTIGGSVAHADPAAELPATLLALGANFRIAGLSGLRDVPAEDFFLMYFTTCLQADEILTEVRVPALPPRTGYAFVEVARRHGDFALGGVACTLTLAADGRVASCRLGLVGMGMTPIRALEAEAHLCGKEPSAELFQESAAAVRTSVMPESDIHGTPEYKEHLAGVLTERALMQALLRAQNEGGERL